MSDAAVRIEALTKIYPGRSTTVAVEEFSLDIAPGEIFGLLGPNGAGKTTTVRILCGLIAPTRGTAYVDGIDVRRDPDAVRSRIGLVPEDAGDYRNLTLAEELEFHGALHGLSAQEVRERSGPLLRRLGLEGRSAQRLKTYSRGMRRKFHLIRALLHRPRVLLLDEPTAGLDPSVVEEVWDLFKLLSVEHQVTVVLCSHHLEEVERLCSRVAILKRRLLVCGSLAQLSGDNRFRLELAAPSRESLDLLAQVPGLQDLSIVEDRIATFAVARPAEQVPEAVRRIVGAGGSVLGLRREGRDLRALYRASIEGDAGQRGAES